MLIGNRMHCSMSLLAPGLSQPLLMFTARLALAQQLRCTLSDGRCVRTAASRDALDRWGAAFNPLVYLSPSPCGNLSMLQVLDISSNFNINPDYSTSLDAGWYFPNLVHLNVSNTSLMGNVPTGRLCLCKRWRHLHWHNSVVVSVSACALDTRPGKAGCRCAAAGACTCQIFGFIP